MHDIIPSGRISGLNQGSLNIYSHLSLYSYTFQIRSRPTSREGLQEAYKYLFERHFKSLGRGGDRSEASDKCTEKVQELGEKDDESVTLETEEIAKLGEELVQISIEEVSKTISKEELNKSKAKKEDAIAERDDVGKKRAVAFDTIPEVEVEEEK